MLFSVLKRVVVVLLILGLAGVLAVVAINICVTSYSTDRIFNDIASVPAEGRVAIVLGARVRNGEPSDMLYDRVISSVELYQAGKASKLLMSGGNDEPAVMKRIAMKFGVPESDIILDDQGLRTYDSCLRAKQEFGVDNAVVVSQDYHLARSIYLCQNLGVDTVALNSTRRNYNSDGFAWNREYFSRILAWMDINF